MPGIKRRSFSALKKSGQKFTKYQALSPPDPRLLEALEVADGDVKKFQQDEMTRRYGEASLLSSRRSGDLSPERVATILRDGMAGASSSSSENLFSEEASRRVISIADGPRVDSSRRCGDLSPEKASRRAGDLSPAPAPRRSSGNDGLADPVGFSFDNRGISREDRLADSVSLRYDDGETPRNSASKGSLTIRPSCDALADSVSLSTHGHGRAPGSKSDAQQLNCIGALKRPDNGVRSLRSLASSPVETGRGYPTKAALEGHELRQRRLGSSDLSVEMPALVDQDSSTEVPQLMVDRLSRARDMGGASRDVEESDDGEEQYRFEGRDRGFFGEEAYTGQIHSDSKGGEGNLFDSDEEADERSRKSGSGLTSADGDGLDSEQTGRLTLDEKKAARMTQNLRRLDEEEAEYYLDVQDKRNYHHFLRW